MIAVGGGAIAADEVRWVLEQAVAPVAVIHARSAKPFDSDGDFAGPVAKLIQSYEAPPARLRPCAGGIPVYRRLDAASTADVQVSCSRTPSVLPSVSIYSVNVETMHD